MFSVKQIFEILDGSCQGCGRLLSTPLSNAPGRKTTGQLDLDAFADVCVSVEVFNADAAADERLVGDMLAGRKQMDVSLTPNVILNNKDKAHASSRLSMENPFEHDRKRNRACECICSRFGSKWMKSRIRMNKTGWTLHRRDHRLLGVNNIGHTLFTHCIAYSVCGAFGHI